MVVILVALMFIAFVTIDAVMERRRRARLLRVGESLHDAVRESEPTWVAGFELPPPMHYHQGHMWAHWVGPDQAYIGVDDFGRRLLGKVDKLSPPSLGAFVHQGEPAVKVRRRGEEVELLSPLGGEIIAVNPELKRDPSLMHKDPYGHGWLFKVRSPHLYQQLSSLLSGSLAKRWMEDVRDRFQHQLMLATGSVIQDGGATVDDIGEHLDHEAWSKLVDEFLLQDERTR